MKKAELELKYVFPNSHAGEIVKWVEGRCSPDPKFSAGIVASIYFDSRDWRFLGEKIDSTQWKTKIRLRWYLDPASGRVFDKAFLEVKLREGPTRTKHRCEAPFTGSCLQNIKLSDPKLLEVNNILRTMGAHPGVFVEPVFRIEYERRRFVELRSNARTSVDWNICMPEVNYGRMYSARPFALSQAVLEVKGGLNELPATLRPLISMGLRKTSFSKYLTCYIGATRGWGKS